LDKIQKTLKIREASNIEPFLEFAIENNSPEPFGVVTWSSSSLMAQIIDSRFHNSTILHGCQVCDLGCGTGLASFACAIQGANVIGLDIDQNALDLCQISLFKFVEEHYSDRHSPQVQFQAFDMESTNELPFCDLLIMADVTYYNSLALAAARRVFEARQKYHSKVLITDCGRRSTSTFSNELNRLFETIGYNDTNKFRLEEVSGGSYLWLD